VVCAFPEQVPPENKNGSVALISLDPTTGDVLELAHHIQHHPPTEPAVLNHPDRQDHTPHAHSANWAPSGGYMFVCEKGLDRVMVYKLDPVAGKLTLHSFAPVTIGGSARHLTVHPNGTGSFMTTGLNLFLVGGLCQQLIIDSCWGREMGVLQRGERRPCQSV
jgi:6-phosphogluconolactonase